MDEWEPMSPDVHARFAGLRTTELHTLLQHGFRDPAEVVAASDAQLLAVRRLGPPGVLRVRAWLRERGRVTDEQ